MKIFYFFTLLLLTINAFSQTQTTTLDVSKDAIVYNYDPTGNTDRGTNREDLTISSWTTNGNPILIYGLIDFDFCQIPEGSTIHEAKLLLYAFDSPINGTHSRLRGPNNAIIQRITSDWAESVSWNDTPSHVSDNQTAIPASTSNTENYELDVTALTQDIVNDKANSAGFIIKIVNQNYYNQLVFAASENADSELIPKLVVEFTPPAQSCITLNAEDGQDAQVYSYDPTGREDRGTNREDLTISEWTTDGRPVSVYSLLDFDFCAIPEGATIIEATLNLYSFNSPINGTHSQLSGSNEAYIQRVTSTWSETVSWNETPSSVTENQTTIPASTNSTQDYHLDLKNLTQDIINDKMNSYGFIIKMANPSHYRMLVFGSGENQDVSLRPTLEVCYETEPSVTVLTNNDLFNIQQEDDFIYPNPVNGNKIYLKSKNIGFTVFNSSGNVLLTGTSKNNSIDVSSLPAGTYYLTTDSSSYQFIKL